MARGAGLGTSNRTDGANVWRRRSLPGMIGNAESGLQTCDFGRARQFKEPHRICWRVAGPCRQKAGAGACSEARRLSRPATRSIARLPRSELHRRAARASAALPGPQRAPPGHLPPPTRRPRLAVMSSCSPSGQPSVGAHSSRISVRTVGTVYGAHTDVFVDGIHYRQALALPLGGGQ